ncbi:MAG TPA: PrsW family glutamic-type intramembrane protease [Candidatus Paceibacterota bacterium]|jgi:RsiW-degrading membrane proteinase PrsW (M82 family)|nr:PrsW family glutamic-type intramembrane protease [Candidatus Paceibacterota bacterium]HOH11501.1 PrsW family glutamic-type intramembrane protease [Candidatus Paceibacterota bacterium]
MSFTDYIKIFMKALDGWGGHSILFAVLFGLAPTIFWLWFWLQEDEDKPEPARMILKTFVVGGFSVVIAFCLERLVAFNPDIAGNFQSSLSVAGIKAALITLWPILAWAFIEEVVKYAAAYIAAFRKQHFDEPVDAMVYMITAALGFAAVENFLFLFSTALSSGANSSSFVFTGNLRFLGATLLHVVTSATLGAFIGFSFYKNSNIKKGSLGLGLVAATVLHTLFNFFIIIDEGKNIFGVLVFLWIITTVIIFVFEVVKKVGAKSLPSNL